MTDEEKDKKDWKIGILIALSCWVMIGFLYWLGTGYIPFWDVDIKEIVEGKKQADN